MSKDNLEDVNSLSADEAAQDERLVPVSEPIRYRKRAQSAEKKAAMLQDELERTSDENTQLSEQLRQLKTEFELVEKLASAGVSDLETAVLIAKARIEAQETADIDGVVGQLRKEKQYLFGKAEAPVAAGKTAGAKQKATPAQSTLERAARKAAATGSRLDLQKYLKLRRSYA